MDFLNMPRGGARPNSGPKKGTKYKPTLDKEAAREALRAIVLREMESLVASQMAAAKGISYLVARDKASGKFIRLSEEAMTQLLEGDDDEKLEAVEVWQKDPSVQAFTDLMNRALDKPKEQKQEFEVTGELTIIPERLAAARKRLAARGKK